MPRFRYHCTPKVRCRGTRLSSGAKQHKASAASAVELAHEAREGFDGFEGDRVVQRYAHTAYGAVAGRAHETSGGSFACKLLFYRFIAPSDAANNVHLRALAILDASMQQTAAC